jgi:uncharacterized protein (DUF924 family)
MYRDQPESFARDNEALSISKKLLAKKNILTEKDGFGPMEWFFVQMPFMHSEDLEVQRQGLELFKGTPDFLAFAQQHHDIIEQFGRFPHRNQILGRESTAKEFSFLEQPNSKF